MSRARPAESERAVRAPHPNDPKLRCLFLAPVAPFPARDGGRLRVLHLAAGLAARGHAIAMVALDDGRTDRDAVANLAERGIDLTLIPHRPTWIGTLARSLASGRSLYGTRFRSPAFANAVRAHLRATWTDTVQCEYGYMGGYLVDLPSSASAKLVLDEHNLEWELAGTGRRPTGPASLPYWAYTKRERRLRYREELSAALSSDQVLTVSPDNQRALVQAAPGLSVAVVPNGVDTNAGRSTPAGHRRPQVDLVFVGKLDYGPNLQGILWFLDQVWPEVRRRRPSATLSVVGRTSSAVLTGRDDADGVEILGEVEDTGPYLQAAKVAIVPLLRGSGTRLKVLEALAAGCPVVSTTVGAAGLELSPGIVAIADDPIGFARRTLDLLADPAGRELRAERGRAEARARFSWEGIVDQLEEVHRRLAVAARTRHQPGLRSSSVRGDDGRESGHA